MNPRREGVKWPPTPTVFVCCFLMTCRAFFIVDISLTEIILGQMFSPYFILRQPKCYTSLLVVTATITNINTKNTYIFSNICNQYNIWICTIQGNKNDNCEERRCKPTHTYQRWLSVINIVDMGEGETFPLIFPILATILAEYCVKQWECWREAL